VFVVVSSVQPFPLGLWSQRNERLGPRLAALPALQRTERIKKYQNTIDLPQLQLDSATSWYSGRVFILLERHSDSDNRRVNSFYSHFKMSF
jgi:hypothetical protein